jgi:tetratricopeptide (TPR) repeat protein
MPDAAELLTVGLANHRAGRLGEAEAAYRQALIGEPDHASLTKMLGVLLFQTGRVTEALDLLQRASVLAPADADACYNYANALKAQGTTEQAIFLYRRAIELNPRLTAAHYNLGNALKSIGLLIEAIEAYRRALATEPTHFKALNNLGTALLEAGRADEAIATYQRAAALQPDVADAFKNLGHAYRSAHQWEAATAGFRKAIARDPRSAEIRSSLGFMLLLQGNLVEGFAAHEARLQLPQFAVPPQLATRLWDGSELNGRRILLHAEQGLGDTIQFIRYVPLVKKKQGYCIVVCQPELKDILTSMRGMDELTTAGQVLPPFDVYCPLMSLPHRLHTTLETIPAEVPYLFADPQRATHWQETVRAHARGKMKIGLVWGAKPAPGLFAGRSIPLALFEVFSQFSGSIAWFGLQRGAAADQLSNAPPGLSILDCEKDSHGFADTAAVLHHLDLLISVDTSVAHLAGALGRTTWVLLSVGPDWRWMEKREDSPWYPTLRLFRQEQPGDWPATVRHLTDELCKRASQ